MLIKVYYTESVGYEIEVEVPDGTEDLEDFDLDDAVFNAEAPLFRGVSGYALDWWDPITENRED